MGTPTQTYVDPAIAGDSGAGSDVDPYGDLQYALDEVTRDAANGDQFNIKAGTAEAIVATLDLSTYGNPARASPIIFRGYTSAANDGGVGAISGGGGDFSVLGPEGWVRWLDMELTNTGTAPVVVLASFDWMQGCEIHNSSDDGVDASNASGVWISGCHIHNCGAYGMNLKSGLVEHCYFQNDGGNDFTCAILLATLNAEAHRNIITIDGASGGIRIETDGQMLVGNSILSSAGTGVGIYISANYYNLIASNLVEGFSGIGGIGIDHSTVAKGMVTHNGVFNCTTKYDAGDAIFAEDNEELGSSPFAKSGADTFANRFVYFSPNDVGNVRGGAYVG